MKKGNDKYYEDLIKNSFRIIKKYVSSNEDCKDLAQIVIMKYHLNRDRINHENLDNWIYTTTKNTAIDFLRKSKNDPVKSATSFELIENQLTNNFLDDNPTQSENIDQIIERYTDILSKPERELLKTYAENGFRVKKIARRKKQNYEALKKRIYRLKSELRANYNREMGMIASKQIVGAKLHENLMNFLKKFKKALENNKLETMNIYLRDCRIPPKVPNINIKSVKGYDIKYISDNKYQLYVAYDSTTRINQIFLTVFEIYNENAIKIVDFPKSPQKFYQIEVDNLPPELQKLAVRDEKGLLKLKSVDLKTLEKFKKKEGN